MPGQGQGVLLAVQAMPKPHVRCQAGELVALWLAEKMPPDPGWGRTQLGHQLLGVVLADVHQTGADGGGHGVRPQALGHGHDRHRTRPAPARSIRSCTAPSRSATMDSAHQGGPPAEGLHTTVAWRPSSRLARHDQWSPEQ